MLAFATFDAFVSVIIRLSNLDFMLKVKTALLRDFHYVYQTFCRILPILKAILGGSWNSKIFFQNSKPNPAIFLSVLVEHGNPLQCYSKIL